MAQGRFALAGGEEHRPEHGAAARAQRPGRRTGRAPPARAPGPRPATRRPRRCAASPAAARPRPRALRRRPRWPSPPSGSPSRRAARRAAASPAAPAPRRAPRRASGRASGAPSPRPGAPRRTRGSAGTGRSAAVVGAALRRGRASSPTSSSSRSWASNGSAPTSATAAAALKPAGKTVSADSSRACSAPSCSQLHSMTRCIDAWRGSCGAARAGARQQIEPRRAGAAQPRQQLGRRDAANARRRQLERQRHAFERAHQLDQRRAVARAEVEVGAHGAGAIDEQGDRGVAGGLGEVGIGRRQLERGHRELVLAVDAERAPRRDQHVQPGSMPTSRATRSLGAGRRAARSCRARAARGGRRARRRGRRSESADAGAICSAPVRASAAWARVVHAASGTKAIRSNGSNGPAVGDGQSASSRSECAVSTASRVLPEPPGPISVTSRWARTSAAQSRAPARRRRTSASGSSAAATRARGAAPRAAGAVGARRRRGAVRGAGAGAASARRAARRGACAPRRSSRRRSRAAARRRRARAPHRLRRRARALELDRVAARALPGTTRTLMRSARSTGCARRAPGRLEQSSSAWTAPGAGGCGRPSARRRARAARSAPRGHGPARARAPGGRAGAVTARLGSRVIVCSASLRWSPPSRRTRQRASASSGRRPADVGNAGAWTNGAEPAVIVIGVCPEAGRRSSLPQRACFPTPATVTALAPRAPGSVD